MDPRLPLHSSNIADGSNLNYSLGNGNMTLSSQGESNLANSYNPYIDVMNRKLSSGAVSGEFKQIQGGHSSNQTINRAERNYEVLRKRWGFKS